MYCRACGVVEHFDRIVGLVPIVIVGQELGGDALGGEVGTDVVLDQPNLLRRRHEHRRIVRRVQRLVLHRERVDRQTGVFIGLNELRQVAGISTLPIAGRANRR